VPWFIEEAERLVERGEFANDDPKPSAESHQPLEWRAEAYSDNAHRWLTAQGVGHSEDPSDPLAVVAWFASYIPSKLRRATLGSANDDGELTSFLLTLMARRRRRSSRSSGRTRRGVRFRVRAWSPPPWQNT